MAVYYIDYNRGNDANAGTSPKSGAWKNLSKLAGTFADNDQVIIDSESRFDQTDRVVIGTIGARFGIYDARSNGGQRATISYKFTVPAGSWVYDAPNNGWYYDLGYLPGVMSWIRLGGTSLAQKQVNALPLVSSDRTWKESGNRVYLYAPASTNPTVYYGSVEIGPGNRGVLTFSNDGSDVVVDGLRFEDSGTALLIYSQTASRHYTVRNCQGRNISPLVFIVTDTAGTMHTLVEDNVCELGISAFIHNFTTAGIGQGLSVIRRNRLSRANLGFPQGAIYLQSRGGSHVYGNEISDCAYGNQFQGSDGCGIYAEVQSDNSVVYGNTIRNCHMAMQDNSGRRAVFSGNLIVDCYVAMKLSDFSAIGSVNHGFFNNTIIRAGTPNPTLGAAAAVGVGWRGSTDPAGSFAVANNVFTAHPDASSTYAIHTPTTYTTGLVANNLAYGFTGVAQLFGGGTAAPTPTGSLTTDPMLDLSFRPREGSPCIGAGTSVSGARHMDGKRLRATPDIGAYRYVQQRSVRSIAPITS